MPDERPSPASIDAVVLDLGGVICRYDFERAYSVWMKATGLDATQLRDRIRRADVADRYERGEMDSAEFVAAINEAIGTSFTLDEFATTWNDIFLGYTDGIEELVPQIAARTRLVCLSNTNALHAEHWRAAYVDCLASFERIFASHEIGARKPEREAYWSVLEYLNLPPWRVAFFDDVDRFVIGGRNVGLRAFQVTSTESIVRDLVPLIGALD